MVSFPPLKYVVNNLNDMLFQLEENLQPEIQELSKLRMEAHQAFNELKYYGGLTEEQQQGRADAILAAAKKFHAQATQPLLLLVTLLARLQYAINKAGCDQKEDLAAATTTSLDLHAEEAMVPDESAF